MKYIVNYRGSQSPEIKTEVVDAKAPPYRKHGDSQEPADIRVMRRFPMVSKLECTVVRVTPQ